MSVYHLVDTLPLVYLLHLKQQYDGKEDSVVSDNRGDVIM